MTPAPDVESHYPTLDSTARQKKQHAISAKGKDIIKHSVSRGRR